MPRLKMCFTTATRNSFRKERDSMKLAIGFVHRVVYAALLSAMAWYACFFPEAFGERHALQKSVCYVLTYPTAVIGRVTDPYRGIDVFSDHGGEWCDFCSAQMVLWYHARFAVPTYVLLFYTPTLAIWLTRRRRLKIAHARD